MKGFPYNDQSLEKNGLWSPSREPYLSCSLLFSDNPALLPSIGMQQSAAWTPNKQGTTFCGTGSTPGLATGHVTTQSSGSAFSSIFYRPFPRWLLHGLSFTRITEAKSRKAGSAFSSRIE